MGLAAATVSLLRTEGQRLDLTIITLAPAMEREPAIQHIRNAGATIASTGSPLTNASSSNAKTVALI
jgi:hypothetical protein